MADGKTVADIATQLGYTIQFLDDTIPEHLLSSYTEYISILPTQAEEVEFVVAFGNNVFRLEWMDKIGATGGKLAILIHPTAYISPTATIHPGTVVLPHAIINTDAVVERGCIINLGAILDHGCVIEEGCHICLGAIVKGENHIPICTKIEAGVVVERNEYK